MPVAGGFRTFEDALWVYGLVIDHVATRLAYLEEELFITLHINIEEYEPDQDERVWIRATEVGELARHQR